MGLLNIVDETDLRNGDIVRVFNSEEFCGLPIGMFTLTVVEIENGLQFVSTDVYLAEWHSLSGDSHFMNVDVIIGNVDQAILLFRNS